DVNVILLDYPSITAKRKRTGNYFFAKKNASMAYIDFVPVMDSIRMLQEAKMLGNSGVNLFFHSMGNIVMRQIIKKRKLDCLNSSQWVNNIILNAPCIPQHGHKKLLDQINFAKRIYINYNPGDYTLGGAYLMSKRYQLGKQVQKPLSEKTVYINFNKLVGEGHSNFLDFHNRKSIPEAAKKHYNKLLHGERLDVDDTSVYQISEHKGIGYDIVP
ncbi:MAG TPA: hypothetical protein PL009_06380, partial [Flavipsychrobacter sp.]|nr:hypothetical protein [Flavipsychrobacter sp.]